MQSQNLIESKILFADLFTRREDPELQDRGELRIPTEIHGKDGRILAFRDFEGNIGLLIPMNPSIRRQFKADLSGRSIQYKLHAEKGKLFGRMKLTERYLQPVFEIFVDNVLSECSKNPDSAALTAGVLLTRWKSLFTGRGMEGLSPEEEVGILAELEVFEALLPKFGSNAVTAWTGPEKHRHDFEFDTHSLEVKATTASNGLQITIHGGQQLEPTEGKPLVLIVRKYERTPNGSLNIGRKVQELLRSEFIDELEFLDTLRELGYQYVETSPETDQCYSFTKQYLFDVVENFPRMREIGMEERVQHLRYTIDLSSPTEIPGYRESEALY